MGMDMAYDDAKRALLDSMPTSAQCKICDLVEGVGAWKVVVGYIAFMSSMQAV